MPLFWRLYLPSMVMCLAAGALAAVALTSRSGSVGLSLALVSPVVALALAVTALLLRGGIAPLGDLHDAVGEAVERGSGPVRSYRDDEVGRLAADYNALVARMARQHHQSLQLALQAQESERLRISRELHDEVGQSLTLLVRAAQQLQEQATEPAQREQLRTVRGTAEDSLDSVRMIATQLRPGELDDLGLVPAIRELLRRIGDGTGLVVHSSLRRPSVPLSDELQVALYRIAQEALTNVVRHSGAHAVTCVLRPDGDRLHLSIRDDGSGGVTDHGSGLQGMRERAAIVGGELSVVSVPGHGTSVDVRVPSTAGLTADG